MTVTTRDRLVTAAMALFAERGTRGTTIGAIEEAAGLTRRGGAFYKHFPSKEAILTTGVERHVRQAEGMYGLTELMPLGDLRSELTLMCRLLLQVLGRERDVMRILEKEGDQLPAVRELMFERLIQPGARETADFIRRWLARYPNDDVDVEATATILLGSIVNYRRTQWTFGDAPLEVTEEQFIDAWTDGWIRWFEATT
jgi:AcrR family transcriptional regulator